MYVVYSLSVPDHRVRILFMHADLENSKAWLDMYVGHQLVSADPNKQYHVEHVDTTDPAQIHLYVKRTVVKSGYVWSTTKERSVLETVFGVAVFGGPEPYARWQKPLLSISQELAATAPMSSASGTSDDVCVVRQSSSSISGQAVSTPAPRCEEVVIDCSP
jgi:hypothetical protein